MFPPISKTTTRRRMVTRVIITTTKANITALGVTLNPLMVGLLTVVVILVAATEAISPIKVQIVDSQARALIHTTLDRHNAAEEDISTICNGQRRALGVVAVKIAPAMILEMDHRLPINLILTTIRSLLERVTMIIILGT